MTGPAPLGGAGDVAASHHAALSRSQAAEHGLSAAVLARLVRAGVLERASGMAFTFVGSPRTWMQRLAVAVASAPGVVVSHRAAARLHGLDGFEGDVVEVTVSRGGRLRLPGVIVHQVSTPLASGEHGDVTAIDGVPVTTLARTIVDLGAVVTAGDLERACDDFERRGLSLAWLEQTAERLHRPGQRGSKAVQNRAGLLGWDFRYLGWADRKTPTEARRFLEQLAARRCRDLGIPANWGPERPL